MKTTTKTLLASSAVILATAAAALAGSGTDLTTEAAARIDASSNPVGDEPTLTEMRAATAKYLDVNVALAEGYIRDPADMCETADMMGRPAAEGAMGIHFFRPDLLGIAAPPNPRVDGAGTHTDFRNPAVLLYEPQANGSLALVGVENLVFQAAWKAANADAPSFHGRPWDAMADDPATALDEAHGFERHFDRHVWLWRENPNGIFEPFNPDVTCEHHSGGHKHGKNG